MTQYDFMQIEEVAVNDLLNFDLGGANQANHIQVGHKADPGKNGEAQASNFPNKRSGSLE